MGNKLRSFEELPSVLKNEITLNYPAYTAPPAGPPSPLVSASEPQLSTASTAPCSPTPASIPPTLLNSTAK